MKAFRKDFFREILKNKGRFLSVFFISLLGAAFFSGIRSAEGDMKTSADAYYDQTNYMDLRVLGTLGLTDTDMEDIAKVKGVAQVTGGHTLEVLHKEGEKEQTVKLIALEDGVNEPQILDGRLPQKTDEILVDQKFLDETGKKIGDQVIFESGTDTALSDDLVHETFTIVGSATLPYYMELTRGTGSIGNGSIDSFGLLHPETFTSEIYTEIYVQVDGAKELESYSTSYEKAVKQVQNRVEELEEEACQRRYDAVYQEGEDKLSDARKQVTDGEKELADGKKTLEDGTLQIEEAKDTVAEKEKELKENESLLAEKETELQNGENQLATKEKELTAGEQQSDAKPVFLRIAEHRHIVPVDLSVFLLFKFHFQMMFQSFSIFFAPSGDAVQLPATLPSVSAAGNNDSVFYLLQPFIRLFVRPDTVITGTFKLRRKDCSVIHNLITVQDHGIFYMIPRYIQ